MIVTRARGQANAATNAADTDTAVSATNIASSEESNVRKSIPRASKAHPAPIRTNIADRAATKLKVVKPTSTNALKTASDAKGDTANEPKKRKRAATASRDAASGHSPSSAPRTLRARKQSAAPQVSASTTSKQLRKAAQRPLAAQQMSADVVDAANLLMSLSSMSHIQSAQPHSISRTSDGLTSRAQMEHLARLQRLSGGPTDALSLQLDADRFRAYSKRTRTSGSDTHSSRGSSVVTLDSDSEEEVDASRGGMAGKRRKIDDEASVGTPPTELAESHGPYLGAVADAFACAGREDETCTCP